VPGAHPATISVPQQDRERKQMEKPVAGDKHGEIPYRLLPWVKQTRLGEN